MSTRDSSMLALRKKQVNRLQCELEELETEIARLRAALEEIIRKSREDYAVVVACRALAKEGK